MTTYDVSNIPTNKQPVKRSTHPASSPLWNVQSWKHWLVVLVLILSDILLAAMLWGFALMFQHVWGETPLLEVRPLLQLSFTLTTFATAVWVGMRALLGLYPGYGISSPEELRRQSHAAIGTLAIIATVALAFQIGELLSRLLVGLSFLGLLLLAPLGRYLVKLGLHKIGLWGKPVVIIGAGRSAGKHLRSVLRREWGLGFKPVAVFDFPRGSKGSVLEGPAYGGTVTEALREAYMSNVDTVIFAMPFLRRGYLAEFVGKASRLFRYVIVIPNLNGITTSGVIARDFAGTFGVEIKHNLLSWGALATKRIVDLVLTTVGGILILPLLVTTALVIKLDSKGPVFYSALRMGRNDKPFWCLKFRTMVPEAEALLERMLEENSTLREEYIKYHKLRHDPRVTRIGRFLRKTSLDELPQLWNVLRGEMSLVGPRPYLPRESEKVGYAQDEVLRVPPGITGPWQVAGRSHVTFKERVLMDVHYVRDWSVWLDLVLLARTVEAVIFKRTAF